MKRYVQPVAQYVLYLFAFLWPLQVLVYVPGLNATLPTLLASLAILLLIADLVYGNTLRPPSELLWPVLLIALIIGAASLFGAGGYMANWQYAGALLFFLAAAHFAVSLEIVQRWLIATAAGATLGFVLTLLSPNFGWHATAYALDSPALLTFAYDLPRGAFTFFAGLVFGAAGAFALPFPRKLIALLAALACAAGLLLLALASRPGWHAWSPPNVFDAPWPALLAVVAVAWLWARATAKVVRDAYARRTPWHAALLVVSIAGALWLVASAQVPGLPVAYILGAAAGVTLPALDTVPRARFAPVLATLALPLVALNLVHVYPAHDADPRNYGAAAAADLRRGDFDTLERRMRAFERRMPMESRLRLWLARAALAEGNAEASVVHMAEALRRAESTADQILPPVNEQETQEWLVTLRDTVLARPEEERGWAYEWALATVGEKDSALFAAGVEPSAMRGGRTTASLTRFLPFLLQLPTQTVYDDSASPPIPIGTSFPEVPNGWPDSDIIALLRTKGARVIDAPAGVPDKILPVVFAVRPAVDALNVYAGTETFATSTRVLPGDGLIQQFEPDAHWETSDWKRNGARWRFSVFVRHGSEQWLVAAVEINPDGHGDLRWIELTPPPVAPYTPLVLVWTAADQ